MSSTIEAANHALQAALAQGHSSSAAALYTEDAVLVTPSAEVLQGQATIERFWHTGIEAGIGRIEMSPILIDRRALLAYGLGTYRWRIAENTSDAASDSGAYLAILERDPTRRWKRALDFYASTRRWSAPDRLSALSRHETS